MGNIKTNKDFEQVTILIEEAWSMDSYKVNEELVHLYFNIGSIVSMQVLEGAWGENTVGELATFIQQKFPGFSGFTRRGLYRMKQFYEIYSSDEFILPLLTQLEAWFTVHSPNKEVSAASNPEIQMEQLKNQLLNSLLCKVTWSNHLEILSQTQSGAEKLFYLLNCIKEKWSMRDLRRQLSSCYFERTMLSNKKASPQLPQHLFKDLYIFEFLDLPDVYSEKDLERALILNSQKFILEIGKGFIYMGSQYHLQVGNKDYYTDLLFYHRDLQCLVLFELKIQEFEPEFLGKLNFYLEALDRDVKLAFENNSIGILLCKGKDTEVVEYAMARNTSRSIIADYETRLIPKNVLANKLQQLSKSFG